MYVYVCNVVYKYKSYHYLKGVQRGKKNYSFSFVRILRIVFKYRVKSSRVESRKIRQSLFIIIIIPFNGMEVEVGIQKLQTYKILYIAFLSLSLIYFFLNTKTETESSQGLGRREKKNYSIVLFSPHLHPSQCIMVKPN